MTSSTFSLLNINPGVENLILIKVSSGDRGLQSILNLRLVCSTTKKWIDNLPKRIADVVFSRAQVKLKLEFGILHDFLLLPTPFGVTALSLAKEDFYIVDKDLNEPEDTQKRFCDFWRSKLEILELKPEPDRTFPFKCDQLTVLTLLESPNLRTLVFHDYLGLSTNSSLPSCFQKVREIHLSSICHLEDKIRSELFTQLRNNTNLGYFSTDLDSVKNVVEVTKLIDCKKDDSKLNLTFNLGHNFCHPIEDLISDEVIRGFVLSVVGSKSKIRLEVYNLGWFKDKMESNLRHQPRSICVDLCKMVESATNWKPTEESISQLEDFPRLKKLANLDLLNPDVNLERLKFPASIEKLGFCRGFPSGVNFPQFLTTLKLLFLMCSIDRLVDCLNIVESNCLELRCLTISQWKSTPNLNGSALNFENTSGFSKLRKLCLRGTLSFMDDVGDCRRAIANAFNWRSLELRVLNLSFVGPYGRPLPLVHGEVLRHLQEGNSAKSLAEFRMNDGCVPQQDLPLLQDLLSLVATNLRKRVGKQRHVWF